MKKILFFIITFFIFMTKTNNITYFTNFKTVALTFDDGPSIYTKKIIDLLDKYNYNATFFLVGNKIEKFKEDVKYITINNEIGNHTYNHIWSTKYKNTKVLEEIKKTNDIIYDVTKIKCKYFRPSYEAINKNLRSLIKEEIVMWSLDSRDWKYRNRNSISKIVLNNIKDGDIILMHELNESYESLKIILPELKKQHYQVVTVSTLNEIRKIRERNA